MTFSPTAQIALTFAKDHDWGVGARLAMVDGAEALVGIVERYSGGDDVLVALPARRSALMDRFY